MRLHSGTVLPLVTATLMVALGTVSAAAAAPSGDESRSNHAGYLVTDPDAVHDITAHWVVPTATCTAQTTFSDVQVELARKTQVFKAGTAVNCRDGKPTYSAWNNFGGRRDTVPRKVAPGDLMRLTISWFSREASYGMEDLTRHWGLGQGMADGVAGVATRVSFGIAARSSDQGVLPLTDVGTVAFLGCVVDGQSLSPQTATPVTMKRDGLVRARPGSNYPPGDFTVRWRHA